MKKAVILKYIVKYPFLRGLGGLFLLFISFTLQAQNGEQITDQAAQAYQAANGITAGFVMNNSKKKGYAAKREGTIEIKGGQFVGGER
ncbi:MAG: hypothetical protein LIP01_13915, partial [Tannerellaceae bacterium]|nr:hypothetical protein [Tannerellaceae bacterium]